MTFAPLIDAPFTIQLHVFAAVCAIVLGPLALWRRSRDRWHKGLGYAWVCAMSLTAVSSFWILHTPMFGPFSVIHGLSIFTIWGLYQGIKAARQGRISYHKQQMQGLYFWALGVAGLFTFLPQRRMNKVFFPEAPVMGFVGMAVVIGAGLIWYAYRSRKTMHPV